MSTELEIAQKYLLEAYQVAQDSPDPSTQNGAVIPFEVGSSVLTLSACNTFPDGVKSTPERLVRPLKYHYLEHAERNVVYLAAKTGLATKGATMYVPWFACADCSRVIICAGIKKVVGHQRMFDQTPERWKESINAALDMLKEAGVETWLIDEVPGAPVIRFNEQAWQP